MINIDWQRYLRSYIFFGWRVTHCVEGKIHWRQCDFFDYRDPWYYSLIPLRRNHCPVTEFGYIYFKDVNGKPQKKLHVK